MFVGGPGLLARWPGLLDRRRGARRKLKALLGMGRRVAGLDLSGRRLVRAVAAAVRFSIRVEVVKVLVHVLVTGNRAGLVVVQGGVNVELRCRDVRGAGALVGQGTFGDSDVFVAQLGDESVHGLRQIGTPPGLHFLPDQLPALEVGAPEAVLLTLRDNEVSEARSDS